MLDVSLTVTDFLSLVNQTLEIAYPVVTVEGELAEFRVSKGRWLYFKLKDDTASINCFGSIYQMPGPLEDGMLVKITGAPRHHLQYGFSFNVQSIAVSGEGSLKKAQDLLMKKLTKEGLFDGSRKRPLPTIPESVGLITSHGSAAEADFIKIVNERWGGMTITRRDSLVQGMDAPIQLVAAIQDFSALPNPPEVLVLIRGGGSQDDLSAFSDERVVRAVSASRVPTLVAIGHETDLSLAELAADKRASTPTNAAQLLVPDRRYEIGDAWGRVEQLGDEMARLIVSAREDSMVLLEGFEDSIVSRVHRSREQISADIQLLTSYDPRQILRRGYSLIKKSGHVINSKKSVKKGDSIDVQFADGSVGAIIS